jgi:hypothetical protein
MIRIAFARLAGGESGEPAESLAQGGPLDYLLLTCDRESLGQLRGLVNGWEGRLRRAGTRLLVGLEDCKPGKVAALLRETNAGIRVGAVTGAILDWAAGEIQGHGVELPAGLKSIQALAEGAAVAGALRQGAEIVVVSECLGESLAAAAGLHAYAWGLDNYGRLAGAAVAGRILGAGPVACGGGCTLDWETLDAPSRIDGPVAELEEDGTFAITKQAGSGGEVSRHCVLDALLGGIGDPAELVMPELRVDITALRLGGDGKNRVVVRGARGEAGGCGLAVTRWSAGWRVTAMAIYAGPAALQKAYAADRILRERAARLNLAVEEIHGEFLGAGAWQTEAGGGVGRAAEVVWRVAVRGASEAEMQRVAREIRTAVRSGPPGGYLAAGAGEPLVEEMCGRRICRIPAHLALTKVEVR